MELKTISKESVPRALELGERYRLLNEPDQAASICRDVLEVDPDNQEAARMLLLALTDQFGPRNDATMQQAETVATSLHSPYDRAYYCGVICERWGRSKMQEGVPAYVAGDYLRKAMEYYEEAERHRPPGDDAALLRWNTCARLLKRIPQLAAESQVHEMHFGD
jgi:hypothetical protein